MYILERFLGVFTYMALMLLFVFLIYRSNNKSNIKKYLLVYLIALFLLAFFYIPSESADLYRFFKSAEIYANMPFNSLLGLIVNSGSPMNIVYFYLLGLTGIKGLIPAVTALVFYGCSFKMLYSSFISFKFSNKDLSLSLLLFMTLGSFLLVISSIRCFVAFPIIALCCYNEIIEHKSVFLHLPLYFFAALMHPAAFVLVLIRFLLLPFNKEKKRTVIFKIAFLSIFLFVLIKYGNQYISLILNKADTYIYGNVYSYIWEYVIGFIYILFSTFCVLNYGKYIDKSIEIQNYKRFYLFINFVILFFSFEYSIFTRFLVFSSILFLPLFANVLSGLAKNNKESKMFTFIFIITIVLLLFLVAARGNLSGYKFVIF